MSEQQNSQVMRDAFDAWNSHDADHYVALLDVEYIGETHATPALRHSRESAREAMSRCFAVIPDLRFDVRQVVAVGKRVVATWLATGSLNNDSAGLAGRRIQASGCTVAELENGRIVHAWNYWDTDEVLKRLPRTAQRGDDGALHVHRVPAASGAV